jgi:hypothetical protein
MSATSRVAAVERPPSRLFAALAALALMTLLAMAPRAHAAELDVATLRARLHDTAAIGLVTKLALKRDIERLLGEIADFHAGRAATTLDAIHTEYRSLLEHTVHLLERGETDLARDLAESSDHLWNELTDPRSFAAIAKS